MHAEQNRRTALITGAASGIGASLAEHFLTAGYDVVLFDIDAAALAATSARLASDSRTLAVIGDVANEADVRACVEQSIAAFGAIHVLINNAGIELYGTVTEMPAQQWQRQLDVNLKGAYLCAKYSIPVMPRGGSIVNISSVHAQVSWAHCAAYDASKAGLLGLTRAMAIDHGPQGIRVNAICPGYIETPMLANAFAKGEAGREAVLAFHPLGRIGTPADVAAAALFLASDAAAFISGATLNVDGCLTILGR